MTSSPSDFNIPPEMRGSPHSHINMLASNIEAFKQAINDQLQELNKMLEEISKNIQDELQENPTDRKSIVNQGQEKIHQTISSGLENIKNDLIDQFPAPQVPSSHIDQYIQDLNTQLSDQFDAYKTASTITADGQKTESPFEFFKSKAKKGAKKTLGQTPLPQQPKPSLGATPPLQGAVSGPSVADMNNSVQQMLAKMFGQGGGAASTAAAPAFDANFVLGLIEQFLGSSDAQSKQVLFEAIQMAMNGPGSQTGVGAAGSAAGSAQKTGPGAIFLPSPEVRRLSLLALYPPRSPKPCNMPNNGLRRKTVIQTLQVISLLLIS